MLTPTMILFIYLAPKVAFSIVIHIMTFFYVVMSIVKIISVIVAVSRGLTVRAVQMNLGFVRGIIAANDYERIVVSAAYKRIL